MLGNPDLAHMPRVLAYADQFLRPSNDAALARALRGAEEQVQARLGLGSTLGKKNSSTGGRPAFEIERVTRLWEEGGREGGGVGGEMGYRMQEVVYINALMASPRAPEIIVFHSARYAHGDPRSTLAVEGPKFRQYRTHDNAGEEVFFAAPDLMSASAYGTTNKAGMSKVVFVYRCVLEDTPNLTITACTGITFKVRSGAGGNLLPIAVLHLKHSPELERAKTLNHAYLFNVVKEYLSISMCHQPQALKQLKVSMQGGGKNGLELGGRGFVHAFQEQVILLGGTRADLAPPSIFPI